MDRHYTADTIAERIVDLLPPRDARLVADFAVGDGSLLRALSRRWPNARMLASDIDPDAIRRLRRNLPGVRAYGLDFLDPRSHVRRLRRYRCAADIIFINPPFSCRGGTKVEATFERTSVKCSKAMAFLLEALHYRAASGIVVAILPASCLTSEKDKPARDLLAERLRLDVIGALEPTDFARCSVQTVCVTVSPLADRVGDRLGPDRPALAPISFAARLTRGSIPVGRSIPPTERGFALAHTTDLQRNRLLTPTHKVSTRGHYVLGPCVLFPRVGKVRRDKICVVPPGRRVLLSDCLIAVETALFSEAKELAALLAKNFDRYSAIYSATCAPYTTLARVRGFLLELGVSLVPERPERCQDETAKTQGLRQPYRRPTPVEPSFTRPVWPKLIEVVATF